MKIIKEENYEVKTIKVIFDENSDLLELEHIDESVTSYPPDTIENREYYSELFKSIREIRNGDGEVKNIQT